MKTLCYAIIGLLFYSMIFVCADEVDDLRREVQSLRDLVNELQSQIKDMQAPQSLQMELQQEIQKSQQFRSRTGRSQYSFGAG